MIIRHEHGAKPRFYTPDPVVDGAANVFYAVLFNDGFSATCHVDKIEPDGTIHRDVLVVPSEVGKGDGCGIAQSGDALIVTLTSHNGDPDAYTQYEVFPGVCVPYGPGQEQVGAPGAYMPQGGGGGGLTDEDKAWIQERLDALLQGIITAFGGDIRQGLLDKAKQAIREERVLRVGSNADEKYGMLRHDARDGAYEAIRSWFEINGPK